ncbi:MAG: hypothetical protein HQ445_03130, partial [Polaromonas sp.]|nr:hypothetical protein [Polaromonas sp.]
MSPKQAVNAASNIPSDKALALKNVNANPLSKRAPTQVADKEKKHIQEDSKKEVASDSEVDAAEVPAWQQGELYAQNTVREPNPVFSDRPSSGAGSPSSSSAEVPKINWGQTLEAPQAMGFSMGFNPLWLGAAALAALAAGGGSKSTSAPNVVAPTVNDYTPPSVNVIDGPISGAKVYVVFDNAPLTQIEIGVTLAKGALSVTTTDPTVLNLLGTAKGTLIAKGGFNENGLDNTVDLRMAFDHGVTKASVITPVTTLVSALVDAGVVDTLAEANDVIVKSLGLPAGTQLSNIDPMASGVNAGVAQILLEAGAVLNNMASRVTDPDGLFMQFAEQVKEPGSFFTAAQNATLIEDLLMANNGGDTSQADAIVSANTHLAAATSVANVSERQLDNAKPGVQLAHDTGLADTDGITTDFALSFKGVNSANFGKAIQVSVNGVDWVLAEDFELTPDQSGEEITLWARQTGLPATQSTESITFTWVNGQINPVEATLVQDTGVHGDDGITRNASVEIVNYSYPVIEVGIHTFTPKLEYSIDGSNYQDLVLDHGRLSLDLLDGDHALSIRTSYPELGLVNTTPDLVFTLDTQVNLEPDFVLTTVGQSDVTDPDPADYLLNTESIEKVKVTGLTEAGAQVEWTLMLGEDQIDHAVITADQSGHWQVEVDAKDLTADGNYESSVSITDLAGNTTTGQLHSFTVANTAPDTAGMTAHLVHSTASDSGIDPTDGVTNGLTPSVEGNTGTNTAGFGVTVLVNDEEYNTTSDANGYWRVNIGALEAGEYEPTITVTDLAGNPSEEFLGEMFTVAAPPESDGVVLLAEDPTSDYFMDIYDNPDFDATSIEDQYSQIGQEITWSTDTGLAEDDGITMFPFPKLSGTVTTMDGVDVTVMLRLDGHTYVTQVVDGEWSVQVTHALGAEGETHIYTPRIVFLDSAGNSVHANGPELVIDREAPTEATASLVQDAENDTGVSAEDGITNNNAPLLEGYTEAGARVFVNVDGTFFAADPADE